MLLRMIKDIKVATDWFGSVLVIPLYFAKVFSESVTWSSSCFTNVYLFAVGASYAIYDIDADARKVISSLNG